MSQIATGQAGPDGSRLWPYVDAAEPAEYEMAVVGDAREGPLEGMLGELFDRQSVALTEADEVPCEQNCVALLDEAGVVAVSPLSALSETILLVNSDLYRTGAVGLDEVELPDVIAELSGTTFHARGYPESHYEKMPLILISRYIERLSHEHGGTHRASFQRLSRIQDEQGTQNVYRKLSEAGVNTHVYGVPDWLPPREMDVSIHGGYGGDYDSSWFVLHRSPDAAAALVALETGVNEWQSRWTFDRDLVTDIEATITEYL